MTSFINLPIVNLEDDLQKEADKLVNAFTDYGFCLLKNPTGYDQPSMTKAIQWFFNKVPEQERFDQLAMKGFNPQNSNIYRGLFPAQKNKLSWKEAYDFGDFVEHFGEPDFSKTPLLSFDKEHELYQPALDFNQVFKLAQVLTKVVVGLYLIQILLFSVTRRFSEWQFVECWLSDIFGFTADWATLK